MIHYSFDHMPEQTLFMEKLNQLLSPCGSLIIYVSLVDCYAWRKYVYSWCQIDAPRHLSLHSSKNLAILAKKHAFNLTHSYRDSTKLEISIIEIQTENVASNEIDFEKLLKNSEENRKKADILNLQNKGDQECFIFKINGLIA